MLDKAYIRRRLGALITSLNELDTIGQLTFAQYKTDFVRRHAAEKVGQRNRTYAVEGLRKDRRSAAPHGTLCAAARLR